jgi:hypothetical protein
MSRNDPTCGGLRQCRGSPEGNPFGPLLREGILGALPDDPPFPLGSGSHDVCHELSGSSGKVNPKIKRHKVPTSRLCPSHEVRKVRQGSTQSIQFRHDDSSRPTRFHVI